MDKKMFKKKALKVVPFVLGAIPGAGAVAKMIEGYKLGIDAQLMMRNANITNTQINMSKDYFANACDFIRASYSGDEQTRDELYSKVYGLFSGGDYYQTELEFLGEDAKNAMRAEVIGIEDRSMTDTMKELGFTTQEELNNAMINDPSIFQDAYKQNVLKNTDIAQANFENSDYITGLQESIPTVGNYFDAVQASDACWNWGATLTAGALAVGCVAQIVLDKKYKKLVKENEELTKEQ